MLERLQKILAHRGVASRRHAEELIEAGRVTVNGKKAVLGQKADPSVDRIAVDGKPLIASVEKLYYLMHKPVGYVTVNLDEKTWQENLRFANSAFAIKGKIAHSKIANGKSTRISKTVRELLPHDLRGKIVPVGRLDKDTSGLLLLTNDGDLAYALTHPKFDHEREYEAELSEPVADGALSKLRNGVLLDGTKTKPATIKRVSDRVIRITITEGRNRQVRRMFSKVGSEVIRLERVRIGPIEDQVLNQGDLRQLTQKEIATLRVQIPSP